MKQKQKKKQNVNNKFNFDDDYFIGVSSSASPNKNKVNNKNKQINKKKSNSTVKKVSNKNVKKRPKMNENKKKLYAKLVKVFTIICLFVGAGCFLCLSPMFNIQEIIVENNSIISDDTVRSLSKIELYKNIFLINKSEVVKNIEENAYINGVQIYRVLPNKIKINIEEREEKYLLQFADGKYAILDGQGYILGITNEVKQLPMIIGGDTNIDELIKSKGNKNRLSEKDLKKLDFVASIIQTCQNYEVFTYITKIDISDNNDIKIIFDGEGKIAHLGSCSDLNTRILYMKEILNSEKGKNGEMFINGNLSVDKVFFRENV